MSIDDGNSILHHGDCLEVLQSLPDGSVDAVVTDPPYGLSFMGKKWDYDVPSEAIWRECLRVLKPGGHLLAFAGTRTQHRMAVRIEDAGFEIRDMIAWLYGSGFPKSHNLKDEWFGWGTALKPALEPITVARKPFPGTVAANVQAHGTGALNIDASRVGTTREVPASHSKSISSVGAVGISGKRLPDELNPNIGRWPANLIHDGSEEVVGLFPVTHGAGTFRAGSSKGNVFPARNDEGKDKQRPAIDGGGSAARFFYCAKASKRDRDEGLDGPEKQVSYMNTHGGNADKGSTWEPVDERTGNVRNRFAASRKNNHPTVKPTDLMRYLCRLVTPPGGVVLDPFMGSGSTGKACALEGFQFIGIEREAEYVEIARARIAAVAKTQQEALFA